MDNFECYFCKNRNYKKLISGGEFHVCKKCGLISIAKESRVKDPRSYYSDVYYPPEYAGRGNIKEAFSSRIPIISNFIKKGGRVLEVGASSGDFLNILQSFGMNVSGVEISERASKKGRGLYNLPIVTGTLFDASFGDGSFDAVLIYHVLEHLEDVRGFLKEVYRVLKSGGLFIVEVPNI